MTPLYHEKYCGNPTSYVCKQNGYSEFRDSRARRHGNHRAAEEHARAAQKKAEELRDMGWFEVEIVELPGSQPLESGPARARLL
jgi:hypothetical protein